MRINYNANALIFLSLLMVFQTKLPCSIRICERFHFLAKYMPSHLGDDVLLAQTVGARLEKGVYRSNDTTTTTLKRSKRKQFQIMSCLLYYAFTFITFKPLVMAKSYMEQLADVQ